MKNVLKKAIAIMAAAVMIPSGIVSSSALSSSEENQDNYYKGTFYYRPGTGEYDPGLDSIDYYVYSDDFFTQSSKDYNAHLATMSMALAEASVSSTREPFTPEGYLNKSRDATALLDDTGFSDIELNEAYQIKPTKDTIGVACAHKTIREGDKEFPLLVILPRSAGYEAEWGDNFVLGTEGDATGFSSSADECLAFAKEYVREHQLSGDIKVWTVGYSRGAAIANIIARKLIDEPESRLGDAVTLDSENLYAYTFGTPSGADINNDPRNERYAGIFNSYEDTEFASAMPPAEIGFSRYGTDRLLIKDERYEQMLDYLKICNNYVGSTYETDINSRLYAPKKLSLQNGSLAITDDPNSYMPDNASDYLKGLCAYLTEVVGGREEYARLYEQPLSDVIAYFESLTGDDYTTFMDSITGHEDVLNLAVAMYAYFMRTKATAPISASSAQVLAKTKELAALGASDDYSETGIDASQVLKASARLALYLNMKPESLKRIAGDFLSKVFGDAMANSGATREQIASVTGKAQSEALVHCISHILLGNIWQSNKVEPMSINNEQIKNAVTLISNAANLFVDHANEIIISWLRTEDSYYDDYVPLTDAQIMGYRRVYISADSDINGRIVADGNTVAKIRNGVLTNVTDRWIGYTSCDTCGFFRIPSDKEYQIIFSADSADQIGIAVGEYACYEAHTVMRFDQSVSVQPTDVVTCVLPAPEALPSDVVYQVTVGSKLLGDADTDGAVTVLDATAIQRSLSDFETVPFDEIAADVDSDGEVMITDVTFIQRHLADMDIPYPVGEPMR